jgi:leucyl-tRNA---protein transferase
MEEETEEIPILHDRQEFSAQIEAAAFRSALENGWRFLGNVMLRHSISFHYDEMVLTICGRIRLAGFTFSKSQQKLLRKGKAELQIEIAPKTVIESDEALFDLHRQRFDDNPPGKLSQMVNYHPERPQAGYTVRIFAEGEHVATSWSHTARDVVDSTYCVYNPDPIYAKYSLGNLTLLLEIEEAIKADAEFYYLGYRYNVSSHFDYKANFNNLERLKSWREWVPCERIVPTKK